jgi:hypothetical protein
MRILRKLIAIAVYAALLLPVGHDRLTRSLKAIEVTTTALDRTMRRRRSRVENERIIKHLAILQSVADDEEKTERLKVRLNVS